MIFNRSFKDFKFRHRKQTKIKLYFTYRKKLDDDDREEVLNLIDNFFR